MAIFELQHRARRGATLVEIEDAIFGTSAEPRSLLRRFEIQKIISSHLSTTTVESYQDTINGQRLYFYRLSPQAYERFHMLLVDHQDEEPREHPEQKQV